MATQQQQKTTKTTYKTEKRIKVIPTMKLDFSIVNREFDGQNDRLRDEMARTEQEMERMRRDFYGDNTQRTSSRQVSSVRQTTSSLQGSEFPGTDFGSDFPSGFGAGPMVPAGGGGLGIDFGSWFTDNPSSPLLSKADDGGKELKLRFDVSEYAPEELEVKTVDQRLLVHAKHEENEPGRQVYREFKKEFFLPKDVDPEALRSSLSTDGILTVEAPLLAIAAGPREHAVAIEHK
ncbi:PREDICTED: heat shock protein beta-6-like [Priapulus caudatus]|uniref:Heat shock protein beta-6-like n=1 Tax=Priapulus caudatus TaxID=37621 RepID=A0ABM1E488_PRICU|nr:PREDICTED: heat shock protein beta-6-like [Priapulus caudatus]